MPTQAAAWVWRHLVLLNPWQSSPALISPKTCSPSPANGNCVRCCRAGLEELPYGGDSLDAFIGTRAFQFAGNPDVGSREELHETKTVVRW